MTDISFADIMDTFFGPSKVDAPSVKDGAFDVRYVDEATLRTNLAEIAEAYGWLVQQEVVVPGWGRIDLVLREPRNPEPWLVELKLDLTKPARIRKAFQQADGYGRWWASNKGTASRSYLVGATSDLAAVTKVQAVYPEVGYLNASQFLGSLASWGDPGARLYTASRHREEARRQLTLREHTTARLAALAYLPSPIDQSP